MARFSYLYVPLLSFVPTGAAQNATLNATSAPTATETGVPTAEPTPAPVDNIFCQTLTGNITDWHDANEAACGPGLPCKGDMCCSQWGWCGNSSLHCGECCQSGKCWSDSTSANTNSPTGKPTVALGLFCTADVYDCGNDVYVSRDPSNNCEFKPCPTPKNVTDVSNSTEPPTSMPTANSTFAPTSSPTDAATNMTTNMTEISEPTSAPIINTTDAPTASATNMTNTTAAPTASPTAASTIEDTDGEAFTTVTIAALQGISSAPAGRFSFAAAAVVGIISFKMLIL